MRCKKCDTDITRFHCEPKPTFIHDGELYWSCCMLEANVDDEYSDIQEYGCHTVCDCKPQGKVWSCHFCDPGDDCPICGCQLKLKSCKGFDLCELQEYIYLTSERPDTKEEKFKCGECFNEILRTSE